MRVAVIGCGTLGRAIVEGLQHDAEHYEVVAVTARRSATCEALSQTLGVFATTDNAAACLRADLIVLAVKPSAVEGVLTCPDMQDAVAGRLVVSVAAGISLAQLQRWASSARWLRAMPNTPCRIGDGMTVLSPSEGLDEATVTEVSGIFRSVGRVRILDERHLDAVTGLSGSGPAFVFVLLEALADGGVRMGLPRDVAVELAAQTMQGAAKLVLQSGDHPAALKDDVTTPAGCTIAGLLMMEDGRIRSTMARTIEEATKVASSLGES